MRLVNGPLTAGDVQQMLHGVSPDTPFLIYDENKGRYQELCQLDKLTYETERREEILPPTTKKNEPYLDEGKPFILLTSHAIEG